MSRFELDGGCLGSNDVDDWGEGVGLCPLFARGFKLIGLAIGFKWERCFEDCSRLRLNH